MNEKNFPNGFQSWLETYFEVCSFIGYKQKESEILYTESVIMETVASMGTGGLYTLAEEWTDEFEELNKGREWDGEFPEEIQEFLNKKNKID